MNLKFWKSGLEKEIDLVKKETIKSFSAVTLDTHTGPVGSQAIYKSEVSYTCVEIISNTIAGARLICEKRTKDGWEAVEESSVAQRLLDRPDVKVTQFSMLHNISVSLQTAGEALLIKKEVAGKKYLEYAAIGTYAEIKNGNRVYYVVDRVRFEIDEVIHIKLPNAFGSGPGKSPYQITKKSVALEAAQIEEKSKEAKNRGFLNGVLTVDRRMSESSIEGLKDDVEKVRKNKSGVIILGGDADFKELSREKDGEKDVNSLTKKIAMAFRVPMTLLGDLSNATYNNVQTTENFFWRYTLIPLMRQITDNFTFFFQDEFGSDFRVVFDFTKIKALNMDYISRLQASKDVHPTVPFDQINERLDLGFSKFSRSDTSFVSAGLVPAEEIGGEDF